MDKKIEKKIFDLYKIEKLLDKIYFKVEVIPPHQVYC